MSFSAGERLRAAREQKGFSIEDVAGRLKVPPRYVTAIEQGDVAALPEPTFVRGYVKAYARTVGIDAEELLASLAPVEVKAPRQLVSIDKGAVGTPSRRGSARTPKFRGGLRRHHWVAGGVLAMVGAGWVIWSGDDDTADVANSPDAVVTLPAIPAPPVVDAVPAADGMTTVEVALPGAAAAPAATPAAAAVAVTTSNAVTVSGTAAIAAPVMAAPAATTAPPAKPVVVPGKGLYLKFRGTSWVEVRDVANVVIHTSIALQDSELTIEGKPPLTLTLGDASAADAWFNGERVSLDRYARAGVARIIVGQGAR